MENNKKLEEKIDKQIIHSAWDKFIFGEKFLNNLQNKTMNGDEDYMTSEERDKKNNILARDFFYHSMGFGLFTGHVVVSPEKLKTVLAEMKEKFGVCGYGCFPGDGFQHYDFKTTEVKNEKGDVKLRITHIRSITHV